MKNKKPNKTPPITRWIGGKPEYQCATFHNEICTRENNIILIPSGKPNKIIFGWKQV
jgi:hypothetical protein